ncbi:hypothetical protein BRADI_1g23213v3 [Brachypodium distachyon]|uniref:Bifunctional inhibitor/plant lipid transfer protein/seed storage helical domain-containing protein n=1 Tax=Brachypodium distachyon TaxID=15368 RepID=A0A0Q3JC41_BRADI|nr:hypothetical protein BRADI_1g23213v3 [Brachypodium distachyon]
MYPCIPYLTNMSVPAPPAVCCDNFRSLVNDDTMDICLCHIITSNPNVTHLIGIINTVRMLFFLFTCDTYVPLQLIFDCFEYFNI